MARKYEVSESVGKSWEQVDSYESIEKHHPTWIEDLKKRKYDDIDGSREEYVESPSRQRMVSKDFVLSVEGSALVDVPSPVSGYVRRTPRLDRWGTVEIYNRLGEDAELIARVRHMEPIHVQNGQKIEYGQLLGRQGSKAPPGVRVGLHTHMDFNEWQLNYFREYIQDLDSGAITPDGRVDEYLERDGVRPQMDNERPADRWLGNAESRQLHEPILRSAHRSAELAQPAPDLYDRVFEALINQDDAAMRALGNEYFQSPEGQQVLQEGRELSRAMERKADALALAQGRPLPTGYSIGTLTGKQDPRDWDHPDHALYSAIRQQLPREVPDDMAAHVMLQARQAGIRDANSLEHVSVRDSQAFVTGRNFIGMTRVDLAQTPPPMEDVVQQSQRLDQQLMLERQQWLAQQQEQARGGPSMSL